MPTLKFRFQGEMKATVVEKEIIIFNDLVAEVRGLFSSIAENSVLSLTWIDEDLDTITCTTDKCVKAAMAFFGGLGKKALFEVVEIQVSSTHFFQYTRLQYDFSVFVLH